MRKYLFISLACLFITGSIRGQVFETDLESKENIKKLSFLVGEWEGTGWSMGRDGQKHSFHQTEKVAFKLDSTAILVEGRGTAEGKTIHDALALISLNKADKKFSFNSLLSNGRGGEFQAELMGDKFYWYPNESMQYIIYLNDRGQWHEIGQIKRNGEWFQFFEMTLDKK